MQQSSLDVFNSLCVTLAMFASAVEASVEEADPLLQIVSVQGHHSVSHHLLLSNQTLQFIAFEAL